MQDHIALDVVAAIAPAVRDHELARALRKHPDSMTSYDLVLQALDLMYRLEEESFHRARGLFQQAIAHDPAYAPAYSHSATWHSFRIGQGWSPDIQADAAEAARCALAAIERDRNDAVALAITDKSSRLPAATIRELGISSTMHFHSAPAATWHGR